METDYPAAHSQDICWFAVDEAGHVGIFDSGEDGHVPNLNVSEAWDLVEELWRRLHPRGRRSPSPWEGDKLSAHLGIFFYDYDDGYFDPISPYKRMGVPKTPLHVDQLPPPLRQQAKQARLEQVDFALHELVQPLEQYECVCWYEEHRVAYLCSDGKTVRPIPGREDRFADFCKQFCKENPKEAKKLVFEGPQEKPKKPRPRRRKENNDGK
jgi:hypothetical protein